MVDKGLVSGRDKAVRAVKAGLVYIGDQRIDKASMRIDEEAPLRLLGKKTGFVGRGGEKLSHALDEFNINPDGWWAMDVGVSTGGFTDCLIKKGVLRVYAVDCGYGQTDWSLRRDTRVYLYERTNFRYFTPEDLPVRVDLTVIDVSFISLEKILPSAAPFLKKEGIIISLVKPQFELDRKQVGKGGIVKDRGAALKAVEKIEKFGEKLGLRHGGSIASKVKGADGNQEYFALFQGQ